METNKRPRHLNAMRHGHCAERGRSREWRCWNAMIRRCKYASMDRYPRYGGRGITVCDRWLSFENFLADMGNAPSEKHTIGRMDNDLNYEPGNVQWELMIDQQQNTSRTRHLSFQGRTQSLQSWANETGLSRTTITQRIDQYGWSVDRALSTPKLRTRKKSS